MEFTDIIDYVLIHEGGYINDPDDPGGETKFGISKRAYPGLDIKSLSIDEAKLIYKRDYWEKSKAPLLPPELRYIHFDTAVNMGRGRAAKLLQDSVKTTADGLIGPNTLKAVKARGTVRNYAIQRLKFYIKIVVNKPSSLKYINGWYGRVIDILLTNN